MSLSEYQDVHRLSLDSIMPMPSTPPVSFQLLGRQVGPDEKTADMAIEEQGEESLHQPKESPPSHRCRGIRVLLIQISVHTITDSRCGTLYEYDAVLQCMQMMRNF